MSIIDPEDAEAHSWHQVSLHELADVRSRDEASYLLIVEDVTSSFVFLKGFIDNDIERIAQYLATSYRTRIGRIPGTIGYGNCMEDLKQAFHKRLCQLMEETTPMCLSWEKNYNNAFELDPREDYHTWLASTIQSVPNWEEFLADAEYILNNHCAYSTGYPPVSLALNPRLPEVNNADRCTIVTKDTLAQEISDETQTACATACKAVTGVCTIEGAGFCYMKSALQLLARLRPLQEMMPDLQRCNSEVLKQLAAFHNTLWKTADEAINIEGFKRAVNNNMRNYASEEDAHEFMSHLLSQVVDGLPQAQGEAFHKIYQIPVTMETMCEACSDSAQRNGFEDWLSVSVPTPNTAQAAQADLQDMINDWFQWETLENKKCEKCDNTNCVKLKHGVSAAPEVLFVQIQRMMQNNMGMAMKNSTPVSIPTQVLVQDDSTVVIYNLVAIINHTGKTDSGEYIADCLCTLQDKWYRYEGDRTTPIVKDAKSKSACILAYTKFRPFPGDPVPELDLSLEEPQPKTTPKRTTRFGRVLPLE